MKKHIMMACLVTGGILLFAGQAAAVDADSPIDPCVGCHDTTTPAIVKQWQESKHSKVGVKCYVCHMAKESDRQKAIESDPAASEHTGFQVTAAVKPERCEGCHPRQVREFRKNWSQEIDLIHGTRE